MRQMGRYLWGAGADLTLTEKFVRMGLDELSVAPSMILKLRKIVREMKAED